VKKIGLSFGDDEEETTEQGQGNGDAQEPSVKPEKTTSKTTAQQEDEEGEGGPTPSLVKKRLKPSSSVAVQAKAQTKSALAKEASLKEAFRKQYLATNEAVRSTEFVLPFVFFEAKALSGGKVRLKKGDFLWLFLERARKIGIELGEVGEGPAGVGGRRREWARIGVDDLMVVVGEMMVPHVSVFSSFSLASQGEAMTMIVDSLHPYGKEKANSISNSTSTSTRSSSTNAPATTAYSFHSPPNLQPQLPHI
jgi:protein FAM50